MMNLSKCIVIVSGVLLLGWAVGGEVKVSDVSRGKAGRGDLRQEHTSSDLDKSTSRPSAAPEEVKTAEIPSFGELRRIAMDHILRRVFQDGELKPELEKKYNNFWSLRGELTHASLGAYEYTDSQGAFYGDPLVRRHAMWAVEKASERFDADGRVAGGDVNSAYFTLVPITRVLLKLKPHVDRDWTDMMVARCAKLFTDAADNINRTHDYLNPRGLEAVSALGLYKLTGEKEYLDRSVECLDRLVETQYPCGAQPYHIGTWIWGRKPSQNYQFLTGGLMLDVGFELGRKDAVEYVRRLMDYSLLGTNRRGEAFVATFQGLHKARTRSCFSRQWVLAAALGDERFRGLGSATFELWARHQLEVGIDPDGTRIVRARPHAYFGALAEALYKGIKEVPRGVRFYPKAGSHALEDISTVFVHEEGLDISMCLLTGYSAFAEADCGDVRLFAVTPELLGAPTFRNAGTDALRASYMVPTEQEQCTIKEGKTILSGRVYTKWETQSRKDFRYLHNRRLDVTMTYADREMVLEYKTVRNTQPKPVPSRLLFLLIARPVTESPRVQVGDKLDVQPPPANSKEGFFVTGPVDVVRFSSPNGSTIEIIPEVSSGGSVTIEKPLRNKGKSAQVKPAPEGSLRIAFEGVNVLDRGRYRIRFHPK